MKILHILYSWKPARGGIISYVDDLSKIQVQTNQVLVMIIEPSLTPINRVFLEKGIEYIVPEIPVNKLFTGNPVLDYNNPFLENKLLEMVKRIKPNVIHIHTIAGVSSRIIPMFEEQGFRTIIHLHDYLVVCPRMDLYFREQQYCYTAGHNCSACLETVFSDSEYQKRLRENIRNYNQSSQIIAVSFFQVNILKKYGLDLKKCQVIPNGVADFLQYCPNVLNTVYKKDKLRVIHISSCSPKKGVFFLVRAVLGLPKDIKNSIELQIHGAKSEMFQKLSGLCKNEKNIHIFPSYSRNKLDSILKLADIAALPSLCWESFGLTVLESFVMGLPVIGSRECGMSEIISHRYNGFLIGNKGYDELQAVIVELVKNPELVGNLKKNVQATPVRRMSDVARELQNIYEMSTQHKAI